MRPERDPAAGRSPDAADAEHELEREPEEQKEERRDLDHLDEQEDGHQGHDAGAGIEEKVRPGDAGDRAARADHRDVGRGVDHHLGQASRHPGQHVQKQEADVPEAVLDVVAEDVEVEEVADQVEPAAVEEHAREERGRVAPPFGDEAPRHQAVDLDEALDGRAEARLIHVNAATLAAMSA